MSALTILALGWSLGLSVAALFMAGVSHGDRKPAGVAFWLIVAAVGLAMAIEAAVKP